LQIFHQLISRIIPLLISSSISQYLTNTNTFVARITRLLKSNSSTTWILCLLPSPCMFKHFANSSGFWFLTWIVSNIKHSNFSTVNHEYCNTKLNSPIGSWVLASVPWSLSTETHFIHCVFFLKGTLHQGTWRALLHCFPCSQLSKDHSHR